MSSGTHKAEATNSKSFHFKAYFYRHYSFVQAKMLYNRIRSYASFFRSIIITKQKYKYKII